MKNLKILYSLSLTCLLMVAVSPLHAISKKELKNIKSGVMLVGVCKEWKDYSKMPKAMANKNLAAIYARLKAKEGAKRAMLRIKRYLRLVKSRKKYCSHLTSTRQYYSYILSGHGSSFLVNNEGHLVTNYHVVKNHQNLIVFDGDQSGFKALKAKVIWKGKTQDLAIIKVDGLDPKRKPLAISAPKLIPELVHQDVWSLGFTGASNVAIVGGFSLEVKIDKGVIRAKPEKRTIQTSTGVVTIEHGAMISHGNSGGPLVDQCGRVLGVNQGGTGKLQGIGWAVHNKYVIKALKENNIKHTVLKNTCDYYVAGATSSNNLFLYIAFGSLLLLTFVFFWMYSRRPQKTVGMTQFVRNEVSRYFRKTPKPQPVQGANAAPAAAQGAREPAAANGVGFIVGLENMKGTSLELSGSGSLVLGRADECDVVVDFDSVGRRHARLSWRDNPESIWLEDLNSVNGTFVGGGDGERMTSGDKKRIAPGTVFYLAESSNAFRIVPKNH